MISHVIQPYHRSFWRGKNNLGKTAPVMKYYSKVSIIRLAYLCCISNTPLWGKLFRP